MRDRAGWRRNRSPRALGRALRVAREAWRAGTGLLASRVGRHRPLLVGAAVTDRCDGQCVYCSRAGHGGHDLPTQAWIELIAGLARAGTARLNLTGGEPLLRRDLGVLVGEARRRDMTVNVNTNGFRLAERVHELAAADSVTVSFDGPAATMGASRGRDAYARALRGIVAARGSGLKVLLRATISRHNVHDVEEIATEARRLGLRIAFGPVRASSLGPDGDASLLPDAAAFRRAMHYLIGRKLRGDATVLNSLASLRHFARWPTPRRMACSAGRIYARLEADGRLFACGDHGLSGPCASAVEMGVARAFASLPPAGCDRCWCDSYVEMNLLYGLNPLAAVEAALR